MITRGTSSHSSDRPCRTDLFRFCLVSIIKLVYMWILILIAANHEVAGVAKTGRRAETTFFSA